MKTIAQQLNVKEFPFRIEDSRGNEIYFENSDGYWVKSEYDLQGNLIYEESSDGYWEQCKYDSNGNEIYLEDSDGYWEKSEYDSQGNLNYLENSDGLIEDNRNIPEYSMEELVEKIGNFKLKQNGIFKRNV